MLFRNYCPEKERAGLRTRQTIFLDSYPIPIGDPDHEAEGAQKVLFTTTNQAANGVEHRFEIFHKLVWVPLLSE
jgi:hypothetical protein